MWNLDLAFADIVSTSSDPRVGAIRIAWWRERLEELDGQAAPPNEPRLQDVAAELLPRGLSGKELSLLEDAWLPLLAAFPWRQEQADGLRFRGRILFGLGARLLGWDSNEAEPAGALWSLVDGARHCSDVDSRMLLLGEARRAIGDFPPNRPPRFARAMTVLAALAAHDVLRKKPLDVGGGSGRLATAMVHRLRGSSPRG